MLNKNIIACIMETEVDGYIDIIIKNPFLLQPAFPTLIQKFLIRLG